MHLRKILAICAIAIGFISYLPFAGAVARPVFAYGYKYFWDMIQVNTIPIGDDMPSLTLARIAARAYGEMMSNIDHRFPTQDHKPKVMTAMWVPEEQTVYLSSSARGEGSFSYHPNNVPPAVRDLLEYVHGVGHAENPARWRTDMEHITGGACGELVILSTYFRFQPQMTSLPANAKIVSVGRHGNYHGQPPRVVNPCLGTADFPGCLDFLGYLGLNWCGTNDVQIKKRREIGALRRRDNTDSTAELDFSDFQFVCHKAKSSPEYSNHEPFPATPNGDVVYQETVPATDATHVPNDPVPTLDMTESTGVSDDPIPTLATTGQAVSDNGDVIPTLATSTRPNVTGPMSNQGSGGQIEGTTGSPSATPSPQSAPDGSGINANPQDPYADTGPGRVKPP